MTSSAITTLTTLVIGRLPAMREAAIAAAIDPSVPTAVILEGIASGISYLESGTNSDASGAPDTPDTLRVVRIAPGCMCCVGNLTLRVTLNRLLRKPPSRLFIALANSLHLAQIRCFLTEEPYDAFLTHTDDIVLDDAN